jgi:hypothetical protein
MDVFEIMVKFRHEHVIDVSLVKAEKALHLFDMPQFLFARNIKLASKSRIIFLHCVNSPTVVLYIFSN